MKQKELNKLTFDEKLDFFSAGKCGAKKYKDTLTTVAWWATIGGLIVTTSTNKKEKENRDEISALKMAKEFQLNCKKYPRNSEKAKEYDENKQQIDYTPKQAR